MNMHVGGDGHGYRPGQKLRRTKGAIYGVRDIGDVVTVVEQDSCASATSVCYRQRDGSVAWEPAGNFEAIIAPIFKPGQRVRNVNAKGVAVIVGHPATVTDKGVYWCDICEAVLVDVKWDECAGWNGQSHGGYYLHDLAPLFAVGDRVRVKDHPYDIPKDSGRIVGIAPPTFRGDWEVAMDGYPGSLTFLESELEPAPIAIKPGNYYKTRDGKVVGPMIKGDVGLEADVDGKRRVYDKAGGHVFGEPELDLVDEAELKIEAGKHYRTRDGRKALVGANDKDLVYPFFHEVNGACWHGITRDGKSCIRDDANDLVAEWEEEPAAPKFKVGDRVEALADSPCGHTGTIRAYNGEHTGQKWLVEFSDWFDGHGANGLPYGTAWWMDEEELRHATTPPNPAIVAKLDNGQPRPALRPHVHADKEAATAEAKRLAKANPGVEFAVYERVAMAKEAKVYEHEWQRLAAGGKKIAAIKALRAQTGLGLVLAKDAVEGWLKAA